MDPGTASARAHRVLLHVWERALSACSERDPPTNVKATHGATPPRSRNLRASRESTKDTHPPSTHLLGLLAHLAAIRHRRAQHVARRQVAHAVLLHDLRALRALAAAGRPHEDGAALRLTAAIDAALQLAQDLLRSGV